MKVLYIKTTMKKILVEATRAISKIRLANGDKFNVIPGDVVQVYEHKMTRYRSYGFVKVEKETTEYKGGVHEKSMKYKNKKKAIKKKKVAKVADTIERKEAEVLEATSETTTKKSK